MNDKDFYGEGTGFPPQVNPATGRFVTAQGAQSVRQALYLILMTRRGERWIEPDFGSNMMSYAFVDTAPTLLGIMKNDLTRTIMEQEPRVSAVEVEITPTVKTGVLRIEIRYTLAETNQVDNIVFPFYLNAVAEELGEEEELGEVYDE